jgi:hypothetical protein
MESIKNFFNTYIVPSVATAPASELKKTDKINNINFNTGLQYENPSVPNLPTVGYYMDFTQEPIGNRPVYNSYTNYVYPAARVAFTDKKLDCKQPTWGDNCL